MRMTRWLEHVSSSVREEIAAHAFHRKQLQAGSSLIDCLTNERLLQQSYARLPQLEQETLVSLCKVFGLNRFAWQDLNRLPQHRPLAEWKAAVAALCEKGLLCAWQKSWGEPSFSVAVEAFPIWSSQAIGSWLGQCVELRPDELDVLLGEQSSLMLDLLLLVRFLQTVGMTRSKQGRWHKKTCNKLEEQLSVPTSYGTHEMSASFTFDDSAGGLSAGTAAVIDIAARIGLLNWEGNRLTVDASAWEEFLAGTGVQQAQYLSREWLIWHAPDTVWQQHASYAIHAMPDSGWYDLKELYTALFHGGCLSEELAWPSFVAKLEQTLLAPMAAFGWLQVAKLRDGRILLRKAGLLAGSRDGPNMPCVSSQGDVMLPLTRKLQEHWAILCCAELEDGGEPVPVYRLTRASVLRGKGLGVSAIEWLHRFAIDIPCHLADQLRKWEDRYGEIEVRTHMVLSCRDESLAEQLQHWPQLRGFIEAAGDGFVVLATHTTQPELGKLLAGSGYHLVWKSEEQQRSEETTEREKLSAVLTGYEEQQLLNPADKLPSIPELYERMNAIPSSWLQELRKYHPSTGRQMMEQAIRYRSGVQLRVQGDAIVFYPERVVGDRAGWTVEGWMATGPQERKKKQFSPKEWEEIQLLLPGINDNNEVLRS